MENSEKILCENLKPQTESPITYHLTPVTYHLTPSIITTIDRVFG